MFHLQSRKRVYFINPFILRRPIKRNGILMIEVLFMPDSIIPSYRHLEHLFDQIGGSLVWSHSFDADNEVFLMNFH